MILDLDRLYDFDSLDLDEEIDFAIVPQKTKSTEPKKPASPTVIIKKYKKCEECKGKGTYVGLGFYPIQQCKYCEGTGKIKNI